MAKILIADDMITVQHNLNTILTAYGHKVVGTANNCADALNLYKESNPDIMFVDILGMKSFSKEEKREIDTFDLIDIIMKHDRNAKIIVLTASPKEDFIKKALILGAKGFLVKGVSNDKIESTIQGILNK